jgi:hypothetical protein
MKTENETMAWNGMTLEISLEPNDFLSRITGEAYASLKVTNADNSRSLINDAFPLALIRSAGGAANFVDVMLSADFQQAA